MSPVLTCNDAKELAADETVIERAYLGGSADASGANRDLKQVAVALAHISGR